MKRRAANYTMVLQQQISSHCSWFRRRSHTLNPRQEVLDIGINSRLSCLGAANAPTCSSNKYVSAPLLANEWSTTVPLAAVHLSLLVPGTNHFIRNNIPRTSQVLIFASSMINNRDMSNTELTGDPAVLVRLTPPGH